MFGRLKIATKLVGVIGAVALTASVAVGWFTFREAEQALRSQLVSQLEAQRLSRGRLISTYFRRIHDDLIVGAKLLVTRIVLRDMSAAMRGIESQRGRAASEERDEYDRLRALFHPVAIGLGEAFGYHDVSLVAVDGTVLYSSAGETAFASSLRSVPLRESGLGRAFALAVGAAAETVHFVDFSNYQPSSGAPAAFIATPVFDANNAMRLGVLIYQIPADEINAIMTDAAGFGATGEAYLLGPDLVMRTNSRLSERATILTRKVESDGARRALAGESGVIEQIDFRGVPVLASFAPIEVEGARWLILAEVDMAETLAPLYRFRSRLGLLLAFVALVSGAVLWEALRRIVLSPVSLLAAGARRVAAHDYSHPVMLRHRDELGLLGESFNNMMSSVGDQVDELKRANDAAERGQRLLEAAPDAMVVADARGRIIIVNASTERLFGYPRGELIGQPIEVLVPEASRAGHTAQRDGYLARPETRAMGNGLVLEARRKDGSLVPVEISLSPLDDPDGLLAVAAVRDISERREAQRVLKESEERLAAAASGANLGLWDVVPSSGRVFTNDIFESQLGYAPMELRETDDKWSPLRGGLNAWVELLHPDDRERVATLIDRFLSGGVEVYRAEHRARTADGSYRWILSVGKSIDRDGQGRPLRVNGVHIDIGEMKALQENLQLRYEELQRLERLRDGLVHMIVHDLRSPLTGVMGFIELLRTAPAASTADREHFIDEAYAGSTQMAEMISSLLDINRLEAGEMPVDRQAVDLRGTAAEAIRLLGALTRGRNVTLHTPDDPAIANCDEALIRRVVSNLLGNALKFTPATGSITVAVMRADARYRIEVSDTGPGIPADFLGRVFDKFSQADEGRKRKRYSTGLGLAFCKLAVEAHGGTIGVSSEVGVGSRFWFELPA